MEEMTVALYLRLSREDERVSLADGAKEESNSIGNQRKLLLGFLKKKEELSGCRTIQYVDDGYSGASFERPGFCQMIKDIKKGEIQCVIVKDFSRFGRDYIELGDYIEHIFPFMGVRFISVNDGYDSADDHGKTPDIDVPFRNLSYALYSQDISDKVKSALAVRRKKGIYIGSMPPYGYQKSKDGKLVPDGETKDVVVRIFEEYFSGTRIVELAGQLNKERLPSPRQHKVNKGLLQERGSGRYEWLPTTIRQILCSEVYTGGLCVREPVIEKEIFRKVQEKMHTKKAGKAHNFPLKGLVRCGECGRVMVREEKEDHYFRCRYQEFTLHERIEYFPEKELEGIVWKAVKTEWELLKEKEEVFQRAGELAAGREKQLLDEIRGKRRQVEQKKDRIRQLYCQYRRGELDREHYLERKGQEGSSVKELEKEIAGLEEEREKLRMEFKEKKPGGGLAENWQSVGSWQEKGELLQCLIERISVFTEKRVEICWKFQKG